MVLPSLSLSRTKVEAVSVFGGYDRRPDAVENTFSEMTNCGPERFPAIGPRAGRGERAMPKRVKRVQAILSGETLIYAADGELYVNDRPVMELTDVEPKKLIAMGAYVIVLPDKLYYNTADPTDAGRMETAFHASSGVQYRLCDASGGEIGTPAAQETPPLSPENGALWLDVSVTPNTLKRYSAETGLWSAAAAAYVMLRSPGIGKGLRTGDAVKLTGISQIDESLSPLEGQYAILTYADDAMIVIPGTARRAGTTDRPFSLERSLPRMDCVFECGNRLWGCRYGADADGRFVNEIYSSKLGDFKNWRCYEGLSTDSYAVSVGSDGAFTGGVAYRGIPCFFKENMLYRVFGAYPAAFRVDSLQCRGVQAGAEESLAILNERLFYKSRGGVCVYDGSIPACISAELGSDAYDAPGDEGQPAAAAGAAENKYYISMRAASDREYAFFLYDTERGMWYRQDRTRAVQFASENGRLFWLDGDTGRVTGVCASGTDIQEQPFEWSLTTAQAGLSDPYRKYVSRLTARVTLTPGSRLRVYIRYDSAGDPVLLADLRGSTERTFSIPLRMRRCDHYRLRFEGFGEARIHSVYKTVENGSELS